jgi:hypothetical protein
VYTAPSLSPKSVSHLGIKTNLYIANKKPKISAAQIRIQKGSCDFTTLDSRLYSFVVDLTELSLPSTMKTTFANPDDILNFTLTIEPDEGPSTQLWM